MRVRISYTVDLEDVPSECAKRFVESLEEVNEVHREIESLIDKMDDTEMVGWQIKDQIDRCRRRLAKLDVLLTDNDMILDGYFATKKSEEADDVASEG
jgi:Mg2+ and Co2+ transporter CorA